MVEIGIFMLFMFYHNLKKVKSKGSGNKHVFDSLLYHCQAVWRLSESALRHTYQSLPCFISFLLSLGSLISLSHLALRFHRLFCFLCVCVCVCMCVSIKQRHRQISNIIYVCSGYTLLASVEGREHTPGSILNSFHFELLLGWVNRNLLPYHVVTSWHPESGSCRLVFLRVRRLWNKAYQSFIYKDGWWNINDNLKKLETI